MPSGCKPARNAPTAAGFTLKPAAVAFSPVERAGRLGYHARRPGIPGQAFHTEETAWGRTS